MELTGNSTAIETFDEIRRNILANKESFGYCRTIVEDLQTRLKKLSTLTATTARIGKQIGMLGINLKIESARFHQEGKGFNMLAQSVSTISATIIGNAEEFEGNRLEICRRIEEFRGRIDTYASTYAAKSEEACAGLSQQIESVRRMIEASAAAGERLDAGGREIGAGIGEIVMAMQFHDISRQQMDNIAASLESLAAALDSGPAVEKDRAAALRLCRDMNIQFAQINSVVESIQHAAGAIDRGLEKTASVLREIHAFVGGQGEGGEGSHKEIIARLAAEAARSGTFLDEGLKVAEVMGDLVGQVIDATTGMEKFLDEIETVSLDVKLLALNALIEAARIGEAGRTLDVLAQELNFLAKNTIEAIGGSVGELQAMLATTKEYAAFNEEFQEKQRRTGELMGRSTELSAEMSAATEEIEQLTAACEREVVSLATAIDEIGPGLRFPGMMVERLTSIGGAVADILDRLENRYPGLEDEIGTVGAADVDDDQYVMERERQIHDQVLGAPLGGAAAAAVSDDDGIELFDDGDDPAGAAAADDGGVDLWDDDEADNGSELWDQATAVDESAVAAPETGEDGGIEIWDAAGDSADAPETPPPATAADDDLGDNVELF